MAIMRSARDWEAPGGPLELDGVSAASQTLQQTSSPCFNRLRYAFPLQPVNTPPCFPYVIIQCFSAQLPGEVQREAARPATAETSPEECRREAETSKSSLAALLLQEALHD